MIMPSADVACAEIVWALTVAQKNFSGNCFDGMGEIFKCMFPDSKVQHHFSMGRTKCSYVINFRLGPLFQKELIEKVKKSPFFSISFDESLNETLKKQQMDFVLLCYLCYLMLLAL